MYETAKSKDILPYILQPNTRYDRATKVDIHAVIETQINVQSTHYDDFSPGRIAFYKGDVHASDSYRRFAHGKRLTGDRFREFIRTRAWLERVSTASRNPSYQLHPEHAGCRILQQFLSETNSPVVQLFRGTYKGEVLLFEVMQQLKKGEKPSTEKLKLLTEAISRKTGKRTLVNERIRPLLTTIHELAHLQTEDREILQPYMGRLLSHYSSAASKIFFSADFQRASLFSKGQVITLNIEKQRLIELYEAGLLYVGIEQQIEFAFFDQGLQALLQAKIESTDKVSENTGFMESDYFEPLFFH